MGRTHGHIILALREEQSEGEGEISTVRGDDHEIHCDKHRSQLQPFVPDLPLGHLRREAIADRTEAVITPISVHDLSAARRSARTFETRKEPRFSIPIREPGLLLLTADQELLQEQSFQMFPPSCCVVRR